MTKNNKNSEIEELKAEIERLRNELKKRKKYGLVWEDKPEEVVEICKRKLPVLKEVKNKEVITDNSQPVNLLIEGDNYHALSVLNYTHAGKIDVIYIDPPYNTGNKDFIFNDRYVDREDAYRHSKWLSFMEKRLKLAKNLLKNDGVIFISIDDNEIAQLKLLMDHIFGEDNFVAIFPRKSGVAPRIDAKHISIEHDYVLCYAKKIESLDLNKVYTAESAEYKFEDEFVDVRGKYKLNKLDRGSIHYSENLVYPIKAPDGEVIWPGGIKGRKNWTWRWSKEKVEWGIKNHFIVFKKTKKGWSVYFKQYQYVDNEGNPIKRQIPFKSFILDFPNEQGNKELENIFQKRVFDYPKPVGLIKYLVNLHKNKNAIILDFMAGTGTTGHAVLELNKEDGGSRQFILCTNNENNICTDVCYPRIKKVIEGYKNLKGEWVKGLGGNLKYFRTDFVDYDSPSDRNKIKLTHRATEMICVKEGTFEKVMDNEKFRIFKNSDHYTGIILDQTAIPEFKEAIKDIKAKFSVYIFSLTDETFDEEFADDNQKVRLFPIPEAILRIYRRIFR
jgi:adenine-specific DNA-methyltransferase